MRMPSTAPRVTGTSLPPTATALRTEAATACRAAGRGDVQWDRQPSPTSTAGKHCPGGGFRTHHQHEVCGEHPHSLASSGFSPLPGALQGCEGGHQGAQQPPAPHPISIPLGVSIPGLVVCRREGCTARAPSRSSGAFLLPWGLCGAGAVGLGDRRLLRRCRPSSTSAKGMGTASSGSHPCLPQPLVMVVPRSILLLPLGKAPRRGRSLVYRSRL